MELTPENIGTITVVKAFASSPGNQKLVCDCGWDEDGPRYNLYTRAQHHIDTTHDGLGRIIRSTE